MTDAEVIALKEALYNQAHCIQELSNELDKERKAAASGADEALSMIFRLQEERAAEKMKASQYRRITEAKLLHAEESMASLIESVLEMEREIATLRFQLQSYRQNMQRVGISDTDIEEIMTFNSNGRVRRHLSVASSCFDSLNLKMDNIDKNRPLIPTVPSIWSRTDDCSKQKIEEKIKFISNKSVIEEFVFDSEESKPVAVDDTLQPNVRVNTLCERDVTGNCSVHSQSNSESLFESNFGCIQLSSKCKSSSCSTGETMHSTNLQDVYEVPKSTNAGIDDEYCSCKSTAESKLRTFPASLVDDLSYTTPMIMQNAGRYSTSEKGVSMNTLQSDIENVEKRVKRIENEQRIIKEEESKRKNEQLYLLRRMHQQMNITQSQTKVSKSKVSRQDEILLTSITEAILSFAM